VRNSSALLLAVAALAVHWAPAEARQRLPQPDPLAGVPSPPDNPLPGGQVIEITLDEAVALGLRRNRTVQAAHLQRAAERFDLYVAERAFAPRGEVRAEVVRRVSGGVTRSEASVSPGIGLVTPLGTQIDFTWQLTERLGGAGGGLSQSATVSVSQPLVRGAGPEVNLAPVRIARLQERINRLRLEGTVSDTITAIVFAYRALMQAQEQVRLAGLQGMEYLDRIIQPAAHTHLHHDTGKTRFPACRKVLGAEYFHAGRSSDSVDDSLQVGCSQCFAGTFQVMTVAGE